MRRSQSAAIRKLSQLGVQGYNTMAQFNMQEHSLT